MKKVAYVAKRRDARSAQSWGEARKASYSSRRAKGSVDVACWGGLSSLGVWGGGGGGGGGGGWCGVSISERFWTCGRGQWGSLVWNVPDADRD